MSGPTPRDGGPGDAQQARGSSDAPYDAAGFGDEEMALVAEALRALEHLGPPLAAYLGGSRAFGLGNALSDVDLTVVHAAVPGDEPRERSFDGERVFLHCQVTTLDALAPLADLFANGTLPVETASVTAEAVVDRHRKMTELVRGRYVATSPEVEALRARFDVETVDRLSSGAAALLSSLYVRDAAGAAESGDWLTAAAAAEMALEYALDAALFAGGDPYRSRKFLPRRLASREHLAPFLGEWRRLAALPEEPRTRETLLLANGVGAATLLGIERTWTHELREGGPCRSPYVSLVVNDAGLRLTGTVELAIARPAAVVWLLADGRPAEDVTKRFAELTGVEDPAAFVGAAIETLAANGALDGTTASDAAPR